MCGIWAGFLAMPVAAFLIRYLSSSLTEYQIARLQAIFSGGGEEDYFTGMLHSFWQQNKWIGKSESDVMGNLPAFNADYILTYLSSVYGTIAAVLLCCVLAVLIFAVFNTSMRQKNQLGMMMGCGCGIVFLVNFSINILENLGVFPQSVTFLPFLSAGGSCIIVSYGLMGIVLSTYRYKNIYPRHLKIGFKFDKTKARKALYVSKMSMCILTGGTVAVMCIAIYWDLCKAYMNIPFKIIAIVLILLLVGNMRRIVQYNEMNR